MNKIVVLGSINMDIVSRVGKHPLSGETVQGKDFLYIPGGKGSNQAIAAHRLGGTVYMLGKIGSDAFGKTLLDFYEMEGLSTENILIDATVPTGAAFVAVDASGENVIYVSSGANVRLVPSDIDRIGIEKGDVVSATLETPIAVTKALFEKAKSVGATVVLNAAPAVAEARDLFGLADYVIFNETELSFFTDMPVMNSEDAVAAMRKLATGAKMITTLGKEGVILLAGGNVVSVKGHQVEVVDTTGAGDCFVGAFVTALQEHSDVQKAIEFGNAAAAVSVQRLGASISMPKREEVAQFLAS